MGEFQKIGLIVIIILAAIYVKMAFFGSPDIPEDYGKNQEQEVVNETTEQPEEKPEQKTQYINVFFIAHNANGEEVYRAVKREYMPEYGSQLKFAIKT